MLYRAGSDHHKAGRPDQAIDRYRLALKIDADHAGALANLAGILADRNKYDEALPLAERSVELKPDDPDRRNLLGTIFWRMERFEEAGEQIQIAIECSPRGPSIPLVNSHALLMYSLGRFDQSIGDYENILSADPNLHHIRADFALAQLAAGHWAEGWENFEARWQKLVSIQVMDSGIPVWLGPDIHPLAGKTIQVFGEQGSGDSIQFCRLIPELKRLGAAKTIYACQPGLVKLIAQSGIADEVVSYDEEIPPAHYIVPLMSLCRHLGVTPENIPGAVPYLEAVGPRIELNKPGLKVGLCWAGKSGLHPDLARSMRSDQITPLLSLSGISFYSLQVGEQAGKLTYAGVIDLAGWCRDFADTAQWIDQLDLVISVDTSVVHLAAAMDVPTWLLNGYVGCWRWLRDGRETSPFYPTMKIYRQTKPKDWAGVMSRVRCDLEALAAAKAKEAA